MYNPEIDALASELIRRSDDKRMALDDQGRDPDGKFAVGSSHADVAKSFGWKQQPQQLSGGSKIFHNEDKPGHRVVTSTTLGRWSHHSGESTKHAEGKSPRSLHDYLKKL